MRTWNRSTKRWTDVISAYENESSSEKFRKQKQKVKKNRANKKLRCNAQSLPTVGIYKFYKEKLIRNATPAEKKMKQILYELQVEYKFQHVLGKGDRFYIVDFYLPHQSSVIEVDGNQHFTEQGRAKDSIRTEFLKKNFHIGKIWRFENWRVLKYPDQIYFYLARKYRKNLLKTKFTAENIDAEFKAFLSTFITKN